MKSKRRPGIRVRLKPEPKPILLGFLVTFVVEKANGDLAGCLGLTWTFETFNAAKNFVDKSLVLLRYGSAFGEPNRHYPFVSITDIGTDKRYDYQV